MVLFYTIMFFIPSNIQADMPPENSGQRWEPIPLNLYGEFTLNLKTTHANISSVQAVPDDEGEFVDPATFQEGPGGKFFSESQASPSPGGRVISRARTWPPVMTTRGSKLTIP
jgi:hypothetical protein